MRIHHVTVSSYSSREGAGGLRRTLAGILPGDAEISENTYEPEDEGGVFTHEMVELRAELKGKKDVNEFAARILGSLDAYDRRRLLENLDAHVDGDCNMYLRLSKKEAAAGNIVLESADSIHLRFKLAAYPAKKEKALEAARQLIEDGLR